MGAAVFMEVRWFIPGGGVSKGMFLETSVSYSESSGFLVTKKSEDSMYEIAETSEAWSAV